MQNSLRITIMLDSDNAKKLRKIQSDQIAKTRENYSFSKAINDTLRKVLK